MELAEQIKEHDVVDYNFMFAGGSKMTITLDISAGDVVEERSDRYMLTTQARVSPIDPEDVTEAETVEVFKTHLAALARCSRKQRMPTDAEVFEMRMTAHKLAKLVQ